MSQASLLVTPSEVAGLEIDSAGWKTDAHTVDIGAETIIIWAARLRATRAVPLDSVAIVYTYRHPETGDTLRRIDVEFGRPIWTTTAVWQGEFGPFGPRVLAPDTTVRIEDQHTVELGLRTSAKLSTHCPVSVQVVHRDDLLRHLSPRTLAPENVERLVRDQRGRSSDSGPLLFVFDTVVPPNKARGLVLGIVVNTADTALGPMTAGLILDTIFRFDSGRLIPASWTNADTLRYPLGRIGPRKVVSFAGGHVSEERVLGRTTFATQAHVDSAPRRETRKADH